MTRFVKGLMLVVLASVFPAFGQEWHSRMVATIPFDFMVQNVTMPAGEYVISTGVDMLKLTNQHTGQVVLVHTTDAALATAVPDSKLVFRRDGNSHVLHQAMFVSDNHLYDLHHSKRVPELLVASR